VCEFIKLFCNAFCLVGAAYKFVCRLVIYVDQQKDGRNQRQRSKGSSCLRQNATSISLVTDEVPLFGNVLRMIATVHRQLDLFKALGLDTILELGMVSVKPTHTGRGMQTCLIAGSWRNYILLLAIWYLV